MFTLHDTIELTKKILIFVVIGGVVIFILYLLFQAGVFLKNTFYPTPPPAAQVGFGKVPPIQFGESREGTFTYTVDTLTGTLPIMPDRVNVYEIIQPKPEFYDLSRAKTKAQTAGFKGESTNIDKYIYQFTNSEELQSSFTINTLTDSFTLRSAFIDYPPIVESIQTQTTSTAIKNATAFLTNLNSFPKTINTASTSATGFTIENGELAEAQSIAATKVIRVDFFFQTVDTLPIMYPDSPNSLVYVMLSGLDQKSQVVEASYVNKDIGENSSDYPIKTAEEAFKELQEGKGYIASYYGDVGEVKIKNMNLAYFISNGPQEYLMPIYVFNGDNGYLGYVSAVQDDLIEK